MKKTALLGLVLFVFTSSALAVSFAQKYGEVKNHKVTFYAGWNLVSGFNVFQQGHIAPTAGGVNDHLYVYGFNPKIQKYIGGNLFRDANAKNDLERLLEDPDLNVDNILDDGGAMGMFIYMTKDEASKANGTSADREYAYMTEFQPLWKGYNLLSITPAMAGKRVSDFKGTCTGLKAFVFDAGNQTWSPQMENEWLSTTGETGMKDLIGMGLLVKVDADCTLRFASKAVVPQVPLLPN